MKLCDIEPLIDKMGLDKMEVKLRHNGEVRWFVCVKHVADKINSHPPYVDIVLYNGYGKAFKNIREYITVERGDSFEISGDKDHPQLKIRGRWLDMKRVSELDLNRFK
ncbi:MAG: hypothetical protein PUF37_05750 [Prevotellaceae bacterium]|nr:hypothetical protein [Prevotellaceae bacterium]